jgi:hypothetical protein
MYNILSCGGWEGVSGLLNFGGCMKARLGLVFLFFLIAIVRKWGGEEVGISFNFVFSLIFGLVPYLVIIILLGSMKLAFVVGLLGSLLGGYGAGMFIGGEE